MRAAFYYDHMSDGHRLETAAEWIQNLLLGQFGTIIAVLAVAITGLNMLWGHISVKESARILLGCFILFGAPTIAQGLMSTVESTAGTIEITPPQTFTTTPSMSAAPPPPTTINPFDPYTGAPPIN